jgi:hypothetical protein
MQVTIVNYKKYNSHISSLISGILEFLKTRFIVFASLTYLGSFLESLDGFKRIFSTKPLIT